MGPAFVLVGADKDPGMMQTLVLMAMLVGAGPELPPGGALCTRPATAQQVARRAVALAFLASRAWLEMKVLEVSRVEELKVLHQRQETLLARAEALKLDAVLKPNERTLLKKDLGGWRRQDVALGSWAMEGAGTLLWTLGVQAALPAYHEPLNMEQALKPLMRDEGAEEIIGGARLRPVGDLQRARAESALFLWRSRQEITRRKSGMASMDADMARAVEAEVQRAAQSRTFQSHNGKDLLAGRTPVSSLDPRSLNLLLATSQAREDALRFACNDR